MSVYCIVNQTGRLSDPTKKLRLDEPLAYSNQRAHSFRFTVLAEGSDAPATLTGVGCTGQFLRLGDNTTVEPIKGTVTGNVCEVILPASCYVVPGRYKFTMDVSMSVPTTGVPAFSTSTSYNVGDEVVYQNTVWAFTESHSAGAWTGTDAMVVMENRTILWVEGIVERNTTDTIIDPGQPIPNVTAAINNANAAASAANTAAGLANAAAADAEAAADHAVRYDESQTLTDAQKATAIANIGAASEDDVADLKSAKADKATTPGIVEPEETEADLYVCDSDGNVIAKFVDGHIVTKNFDSASIQLDLIMEADSDDADLYISDSFGNVVAEFKDGHIVTKNFDSADYTDVLGDVETLQTEVVALQTATSGIMYRNKDATDGVYAACRYHQPNLSSKQFCLLIAGDVHADRTRTQNMVEYLNAIDAFDAGIMLGDISGNEYTDTIVFYREALESVQKPFLTVLGNHDVVGAASDSELYTKFGDCFQYAQLASGEAVSGKCYYYKDFTAQKIRVIVLMQYDLAGRASDTGDLCFGQDQIDWFVNVLNSTPSDYGVIIAEHTNPSRYMTYNMDEKYTSSTWHQSNYAPTVMDGDPIPDIVNAWINGTTLSQTYSYTFSNPPSPLSVSADFTSRGEGEFITYLGGHWHMDVLGTPTGYTDQPDYHTPAAGLSSATQGDIPRKTGTRSEDSLSAIAVDRDKKTVKVFHVGAHFTKDAVDRLYFKYTYGA